MNRNNQSVVPQKTVSPESLLSMADNQAQFKAYENALAASLQVTNALINAQRLTNMDQAMKALEEGIKILRVSIHKELVAMSLKEIASYLPSKQEGDGCV